MNFMPHILAAATVLTAASFAVTANAATLTNRDIRAYTIVVFEGQQEQQFTINPDQSLNNICNSKCSLSMGEDSELVEVVIADELLIEEGQIYLLDPAPAEGDVDAAEPGFQSESNIGPMEPGEASTEQDR